MAPPVGAWRRMPRNRYYQPCSVNARLLNRSGFPLKAKSGWTPKHTAGLLGGLAAAAGLGAGLLRGLVGRSKKTKKQQTGSGRKWHPNRKKRS